MGTSNSAAQLAGKLAKFGHALDDNRGALTATGLAGKDIFARELARKGVDGTTPVSSKVKARFDIKSDGVLVKYTGPAHLLDKPTGAHYIVPKSLGGSRRKRQRAAMTVGALLGATGRSLGGGNGAIFIPGSAHPIPGALHPGTSGLHFFRDAKKQAKDKLPDIYMRSGVTVPLRKVF